MRSVTVAAILFFLTCLFLHACVWRLRLPRNRPAALFFIFVLVPSALSIFLSVLMPSVPIEAWALLLFLDFSLSSAYILSYPAVEAVSPTLVIALQLCEAGENGVARAELADFFKSDNVFRPRINDLIDSGLVNERDGLISLTSKGKTLAGFFILYRRALGLPPGRG